MQLLDAFEPLFYWTGVAAWIGLIFFALNRCFPAKPHQPAGSRSETLVGAAEQETRISIVPESRPASNSRSADLKNTDNAVG